MLENQENQEVKPELTVEEQLEQIVIFPHNLREVSEIAVKPMLDILGLEVKSASLWSEPKPENATIRQELVKLNQIITSKQRDLDLYLEEKRKLANQISDLETYLDDNWEDIDEDLRDRLCEIFGLDQEVTKYVTIKIEGTVEVKAPRGYDWDSVDDDINYDISLSYTGDLEEVGYGFDGSDFSAEAD